MLILVRLYGYRDIIVRHVFPRLYYYYNTTRLHYYIQGRSMTAVIVVPFGHQCPSSSTSWDRSVALGQALSGPRECSEKGYGKGVNLGRSWWCSGRFAVRVWIVRCRCINHGVLFCQGSCCGSTGGGVNRVVMLQCVHHRYRSGYLNCILLVFTHKVCLSTGALGAKERQSPLKGGF